MNDRTEIAARMMERLVVNLAEPEFGRARFRDARDLDLSVEEILATMAVGYADALIAELNKEPSNG